MKKKEHRDRRFRKGDRSGRSTNRFGCRPPRSERNDDILRIQIQAALFLLALFFFPTPGISGAGDLTFADYAGASVRTLEQSWYEGGEWHLCQLPQCRRTNSDWGAAALTYTMFLRWDATHDAGLQPYFTGLLKTFVRYGTPCRDASCKRWSDIPAWDAVAALRVYEAGGDDITALAVAQAAFDAVDGSPAYAAGACPSILYQQPFGRENKLKTLETDSNLIKAALLLYRFTGSEEYLQKAIARYADVRHYFLDPKIPLYSVYVFDDGQTCAQLPHRFFASVNGNMIDAGLRLYDATGETDYLKDAVETAQAVDTHLVDERGIFVDQQAENDIAEPLIEAMFELATQERQPFARQWILRNAEAAVSARTPDGNFGRFFDGPPPAGTVTAWQTNGGLALMIAAAALEPEGVPATDAWRGARFVARDVEVLPTAITFEGTSIALIGTIGDRCCESGHARVFVDGAETFDRSGIWQNKSSSDRRLNESVLFAWRWPRTGTHVVELQPGTPNAKEGGSYLHLQGYVVK